MINCFNGSLILCRLYTLFEDSRVGVATKWKLRKNDGTNFAKFFIFAKKLHFCVKPYLLTTFLHYCSLFPLYIYDYFIFRYNNLFTFFPLLSFVKNATVLHYLSLPKIPRLQYCISHRSFVKWQKIKICRTAEMAEILQYHLHPWTTQLAQNNQFIKNKTLHCCRISSVF